MSDKKRKKYRLSTGHAIVWRLLRRNISAGQLAGYALANLAGLAIVLTAMQFYRDVTSVWHDEDSFISKDYLIISKKVSGMGSLTGGNVTFSREEIADISAQPWARRVGDFTAAAFNVTASVQMGGAGMSTALFLESIPSEYFDVKPRGWNYDPQGGDPVPVIISKDYLTLYNFGFASSRGLPQVSEAMIGMVPLKLSLSGNGMQEYVDARIVGFSSRLNTIAVPEEFMAWANGKFAEKELPDPSRLIIEVNRPGDPEAAKYLSSHDYESAGDKVDNGRAAYFLSVVTTVVIAVGVIISLLAFFILLLSIYLLLQKNRDKLHELMQLGYTPKAVARYYCVIVIAVNVAVLVSSVIILAVATHLWSGPLESIGVNLAPLWPTILTGTVIVALITIGNIVAIRRNICSIFRL